MSASSVINAAELTALARIEFPDLDLYPSELVLLTVAADPPLEFSIDSEGTEDSADSADPLDDSGPVGEVRAQLIRWLCINPQAKVLIDPCGIQVSGARVTGQLNLNYADVPFPITLLNCVLTEPASMICMRVPDLIFSGSSTRAITMDSAFVANSVYLNYGFQANGEVSLIGAKIGRDLVCSAGTFINEGHVAISADAMNVGGFVYFRAEKMGQDGPAVPFRAQGSVRLHSARIAGDLDCTGGVFSNPKGDNRGRSIHFGPAVVKGTIFFRAGVGSQRDDAPKFVSDGIIDLRGASTSSLWDDRSCWPSEGSLFLDGFVYERFRTSDPGDTKITVPTDGKARLEWLQLDTGTSGIQPYKQLAKVLWDRGDTDGARLVLEALEEKLARTNELTPNYWRRLPLHWLRFPAYWLKRMIGFGYRPGRAIWALIFLWLAGAICYWRGDEARLMVPIDKDAAESFVSKGKLPSHYSNFSAPIYSLENTFPLVKLGQADKWQPDPANEESRPLQRIIWLQNIAGWLLATLFVAALSGVVQRD
jgi:hypothetical protein